MVSAGTPERTVSHVLNHFLVIGTPSHELIGVEDGFHVLDQFLPLAQFYRFHLLAAFAGFVQTLGEQVLHLLYLLVGQAVLSPQHLHEVRWSRPPIIAVRRR